MTKNRSQYLSILAFLLILASPLAAQSSRRVADDHRFGCKSEDYMHKLIGYAVDKDLEAFKQGLATGLLLGECTLFKKGEEVFVVDTKIFSGLVKVRRKGKIEEYWTNTETLKRQRP